jgi:putative transposase
MIAAIEQARHKHAFDLWAYVIMPEHVHLLICLRSDAYSVSRILGTIKQPVAKRAILFVTREAPQFLPWITDRQPNGRESLRFWQRGGGFDRNLWTPRHIWSTIDYIHANPVRRGLCALDTEWAWSSARAYQGVQASPLSVDVDSLPDDPRPAQFRGGCS